MLVMCFEKHPKNSSKTCENFKYLDNLIQNELKKIVLDSDIILSDNGASEYLDGIKLNVDDLVIVLNIFIENIQFKHN